MQVGLVSLLVRLKTDKDSVRQKRAELIDKKKRREIIQVPYGPLYNIGNCSAPIDDCIEKQAMTLSVKRP